MAKWDTIAIVGPGLIGASVGLAVKRAALAGEVVGIGRRAESLDRARAAGAVDRTTTDLSAGVVGASLVVVATPVAGIGGQILAAAAANVGALLTDAGSTKAEIIAEVENGTSQGDRRPLRFVGSHPLAGSHLTGPEHARADLFDGRVVVVTPTERTQPADLAEVREFWGLLGARVIEMSPLEHDAAVAVTSHLPHLAAAAIARSTPERYAALVAGGWLDSTRIAAGDPQLWTQILRSNRTSVQSAAAGFRQALDEFQAALEADDPAALENLLTKAKRTRDALGS